METTQVHASIAARNIKGIRNFNAEKYEQLSMLGIHIDGRKISQIMAAMDSIQGPVTTSSIISPVQFLQAWLPGQVFTLTQARKADEAIGYDVVGSWADEQVVQAVVEPDGTAAIYTGYSNSPLSSFNINYAVNTIVRFETAMMVEPLEAERAAKANTSADSIKRYACTRELEISRNIVAIFGYNNGLGLTYGILNTPGLPSYVNVPNGDAGSPFWSLKTTLNIIHDIQLAASQLQTQSGDNIDPAVTPTTLLIPTKVAVYLTTVTDLGYSVKEWLQKNYPAMRVVSIPEFNTANAGVGVFYLYADRIDNGQDNSTDNGKTFSQNIQSKFMINGVEQTAKGVLTDFVSATAGTMLKRPYGVVRYSGIC